MKSIKFTLVTTALLISSCQEKNKCDFSNFENRWHYQSQEESLITQHLLEIEYRDGIFIFNRKTISEESMINELNSYPRLIPAPRILLAYYKSDCEKIKYIMNVIDKSNMCKNSGCLYQLRQAEVH